MNKLFFFFLLICCSGCFIINKKSSSYFNGSFSYYNVKGVNDTPNSKTREIYYFGDSIVRKKVIPKSTANGAEAGFGDVIWNIALNKQYIINDKQKVIFESPLGSLEHDQYKIIMDSSLNVNGQTGKLQVHSDTIYKSFINQRDTIITYSKRYVNKKFIYIPFTGFSSSSAFHIGATSFGFSDGYIPIYTWLRSSGKFPKPFNFESHTQAEIKKYKVPDSLFVPPKGYVIKMYDEEEIRNLVMDAAIESINFQEMAEKVLEDAKKKQAEK